MLIGSLNGSGAGIAYALCIIVPQAWLDKKRAQYNGYLLIGAPIGIVMSWTNSDFVRLRIYDLSIFTKVFTSYVWPLMVDHFTWSGALLVIMGLQEV